MKAACGKHRTSDLTVMSPGMLWPTELRRHVIGCGSGVEPAPRGYEPHVGPFTTIPRYWSGNGVIETPSLSTCNRLRVLPLRIPDGASFRSRTELHRITGAAKVIMPGNAYEAQMYGALAGNLESRSLIFTEKCVLTLNYKGWSFAADLNRAFLITKQVCRHLHLRSMERPVGIRNRRVLSGTQKYWPLYEGRNWSGRPVTIRRLLFGRQRLCHA